MKSTRIVILGAGPAGVGAAWRLTRRGAATVTVIEQRERVGGNAGSFDLGGLAVDYGSHRLHPACAPEILNDLRGLLGDDLLDRPRHGRIRLRGRWLHFPLKPHDLALHLPLSFSAGVALDALRKVVSRPTNHHHNGAVRHQQARHAGSSHEESGETFTSLLEQGLGKTICHDFYFPYAKKIWGVEPEKLSVIQARRRVGAGSLGKMARKVLGLVPGLKAPGAGRFYYPRHGYGQISQAIADAAIEGGADFRLETTVRGLRLGETHLLQVEGADGQTSTIEADHVWSTLPITTLARMVEPGAPIEVKEASEQIHYRAMILIYLVLATPQWTPFDAHYFPETDIRLSRLSEPKNYSATREPSDCTVLCGELPCAVGDDLWRASDEDLALVVRSSLARCSLELNAPVVQVKTKRLAYAYPIYHRGYEEHFAKLDEWAEGLPRVLTFGRQGLFAHDNTHHALAMAYAAVDCLTETGEFDQARWRQYRAQFAEHVVED